MEWFWLVIAGIIYSICAYMCYHESFRNSQWYMPAGLILGFMAVIIWFSTVRLIGDKHRIYFYSLMWDAVLVGVYYVIPILFFNVRLDKWGIIGLALMTLGLVLVKMRT